MERNTFERLSRRALFKYGGAALMVSAAAPVHAALSASAPPDPAPGGQIDTGDTGCGTGGEKYPTSPLILEPFRDSLLVPRALAPVSPSQLQSWSSAPGRYNQDSIGNSHQLWPSQLGLPEPLIYCLKVQVNESCCTTSPVLPINSMGTSVRHPLTRQFGPQSLPGTTIYGFNGQTPGPMINAEYGRPVIVRFENELHLNPGNFGRSDFGAPDWSSIVHLHNGHTAPESDGNPHYAGSHLFQNGYMPGQWVDNLYLNWPAEGDPNQKQSFFWFHDHVMNHTGAGVYKGLFGLYPIYDPILDSGDERTGLRLPGVRTNRSDGAFDVAYDIPLALSDCALDDGRIGHRDVHNGCGESHPEWWGKKFFRHYPNEGFVGDVFMVNGTAYPVLEVKRRKYRFRFLDASISRVYNLQLMASTGGPIASRDTGRTGIGLQGQYQLPDGQRCMSLTQIATDGGLLPFPIVRNNFDLFPSKRREFVVDFTRYMDGTPTTKGDVVYLVNTLQMTDGRKPTERGDAGFDPNYRVPILKFVIGDLAPDQSVMPTASQPLRPVPPIPASLTGLRKRKFTLTHVETGSTESQWLINGLPFDPLTPLAKVPKGSAEVWTVVNGGGGWVHPLHIHQEEHRVVSRNGAKSPSKGYPDDTGKEDVIALAPGEEVVIYRKFRTFTGPYVAHCHNLAHEDHAMMFGWSIE